MTNLKRFFVEHTEALKSLFAHAHILDAIYDSRPNSELRQNFPDPDTLFLEFGKIRENITKFF